MGEQLELAADLLNWHRALYFRSWFEENTLTVKGDPTGSIAHYGSIYAKEATGVIPDSQSRFAAQTRFENSDFVAEKPQGTALIFHNDAQEVGYNGIFVLPADAETEGTVLYQAAEWPGRITAERPSKVAAVIACQGSRPLPTWPKIGICLPTHSQTALAFDSILSLAQSYPGQIEIAIVANGCSSEQREQLQRLSTIACVIEIPKAVGFVGAANRGLQWLTTNSDCELMLIAHDDVLASGTALTEMVRAYQSLTDSGFEVGAIGPKSPGLSGEQYAELQPYEDFAGFANQADAWHRVNHSGVSQHWFLSSALMLVTREAITRTGGFDPRFTLYGWNDEDLSLRIRLSGLSLWVAEGALIHHSCGATTSEMPHLCEQAELRNTEVFQWKWDILDACQWPQIDALPAGVSLTADFAQTHPCEFKVNIEGTTVDLVSQASDIEFAKWVFDRMAVRNRSERRQLIKLLTSHDITSAVVIDASPISA